MKNTIITLFTLLALSNVSGNAQASSNNDVAQNLCSYVSADDKKRLRSFLKSNKLKLRGIFSSVQCNGTNLLEFASNNNSVKTGSLIVGKLSKNVLANVLPSINNAEISAKANARLNG